LEIIHLPAKLCRVAIDKTQARNRWGLTLEKAASLPNPQPQGEQD